MRVKASSSGLQTASAVLVTYPCSLSSVEVTGASGTWVVYDSATATTTGKRVLAKVATSASDVEKQHAFNVPVEANEGIYVTQTGGTDFVVHYIPA